MSNPDNTRKCAHCLENPITSEENSLCGECTNKPRCEVCEVFLDGLVKPSEENPRRCDSCLDFEDRISLKCAICDGPIPLYSTRRSNVLHFVVRGNMCSTCTAESRSVSMEAKKQNTTAQFVGYLGLLENFYIAGKIDEEQWRYAIRMNPHDVKNWRGLEDIQKQIDADEIFIGDNDDEDD